MPHPYSGTHNRERAAAIAAMIPGTQCPFADCKYPGRRMYASQRLDYDHVTPVRFGGGDGPKRLSHSSCNRRHGQRLGAQLKRRKARPAKPPTIGGKLASGLDRDRSNEHRKWFGHDCSGGKRCPFDDE